MFPTPLEGSRLQSLLGTSLKALIKADVAVENDQKGLFSPSERIYILARGMQVMNDKELQNDMRIMATSEKGVSPKNTTEEALQASYIVSGKI